MQLTITTTGTGHVRVDLGKNVRWFSMPPQQCIGFAKMLMLHAMSGGKVVDIDSGDEL